MSQYRIKIQNKLRKDPKKWLITGVAGFIGSNLLEALLKMNQKVVGLDNYSTGTLQNLKEVQKLIPSEQWKNFSFYKGDICDYKICYRLTKDIDYVLHQAALGSVSRSIKNPILTNANNISGFLNILEAAKNREVSSFTYATSSSVYGNDNSLPKLEEKIGSPLSPYAVTKYTNELYAKAYSTAFNFKSIGLRYFNVFGQRQNPEGAYAAVIPKWIESIRRNKKVYIYGDGETSRDFCYIDNVVQANILSALAQESAKDDVYNIALNHKTSLNNVFEIIKKIFIEKGFNCNVVPIYKDFRLGDISHSQASIKKAVNKLNYQPEIDFYEGVRKTIDFYLNKN